MSTLDLRDIQGTIAKPYGKFGFRKARYVFFRIDREAAGREFVRELIPKITTAVRWEKDGTVEDGTKKPDVTTNVFFTYEGLKHLGLPEVSLHSFPDEFTMGMRVRCGILGDDGPSDPSRWDPVWQSSESDQPVHMLISINGEDEQDIKQRYEQITQMDQASEGVTELKGENGTPWYQDASILGGGTEHFGYRDGISDPYIKGLGKVPSNVIGGGKPTRGDPSTMAGWQSLETGEFILGHKDEAFEYAKAPVPRLLSFNGTFMVYRKLHQNVASFNDYLDKVAPKYAKHRDIDDVDEAREELSAKFIGRWKNGAPLALFPTKKEADEFAAAWKKARDEFQRTRTPEAEANYAKLSIKMKAFNYDDDLDGSRCPVGSHIRRANPRGALEFGKTKAFETPGALANRRRILRRGLPYGKVDNPARDDGNHGIIFMALNASIKRQFEFVQQQWINYSNDFKLANDKDPILGNHGEAGGRMVIEGDRKPPFFCSDLKRFVETRGGDYFFIPSLTALRMIGDGIIDPT